MTHPPNPASLLEDHSYPPLLRHGARITLSVPQERPRRSPSLDRDDTRKLLVQNVGNPIAVFIIHDIGHVETLMGQDVAGIV